VHGTETEGEAGYDGAGGLDAFAAVVANAWANALGLSSEIKLKLSARFAELGGDSMAALRVCQRIASTFSDTDKGDTGVFGEALGGALAPARLVRSGSLGAHVAALRTAAAAGELGQAAATLARREDGDQPTADQPTAAISTSTDVAVVDERAFEGAGLLRRAAFEGAADVLEQLLDAGVPVEGSSDGPHGYPHASSRRVRRWEGPRGGRDGAPREGCERAREDATRSERVHDRRRERDRRRC
jgi:hypothetical protein